VAEPKSALRKHHLTASAWLQLGQVLTESEEAFGTLAQQRYAALFAAAFEDIARHPNGPNVTWYVRLRERVGIYHIRHSRDRVPKPPGRVQQPRHLVVFRPATDDGIAILGVLHDRMLRDRALRAIIRANQSKE